MLVADLRDRVPITISDIRHYATARGGFHTHCMERTTGPGGCGATQYLPITCTACSARTAPPCV